MRRYTRGASSGLDPPAEPGGARPEDDRPLLAVHVVHEVDHRGGAHDRGEVRHAVLDVDHHVRALAAHQVGEQGAAVDRVVAPVADVPDTLDHLVGEGAGVGGGPEHDVVPSRSEALGDVDEVPLRAAGLGVVQVAPVEQEDVAGGAWRLPGGRGGGRAWGRADYHERVRTEPSDDIARQLARSASSAPSSSEQTRARTCSTATWPSTPSRGHEHHALDGATVVDVALRPREFARRLRRDAGARYVGLDIDVPHRRGAGSGRTLTARGEHLPFADASADIVMSSNVMEHVPHPGVLGCGDDPRGAPGRPGVHLVHAWWSPRGGTRRPRGTTSEASCAARRYRGCTVASRRTATAERSTPPTCPRAWRWARRAARRRRRRGPPAVPPRSGPPGPAGPGPARGPAWNLLIVLRRR